MENNLFKEVIIMKDFFKDYKELAVDTGRFYKKHWIGCIVLNTAISAVTAGYIFRDQIKDKLKEEIRKRDKDKIKRHIKGTYINSLLHGKRRMAIKYEDEIQLARTK